MNFDTYYKQKTAGERSVFASKAETSTQYIEIHLLSGRKKPTPDTMENLAKATDGEFSYEDIVNFFYVQKHQEGAA